MKRTLISRHEKNQKFLIQKKKKAFWALALIPAGFVSDELFIQFEAQCVRNPMKWTKRRTSSKHVEALVGDCLVLYALQLLWKASVSGRLQTANSMKQIIIIPNGSNNYGTGWTQYKVGCLWLWWGSQSFTHSFYKNFSPSLCFSLSISPSLPLSLCLSFSFFPTHKHRHTHICQKRSGQTHSSCFLQSAWLQS